VAPKFKFNSSSRTTPFSLSLLHDGERSTVRKHEEEEGRGEGEEEEETSEDRPM
jgi:hypothetical protein